MLLWGNIMKVGMSGVRSKFSLAYYTTGLTELFTEPGVEIAL